jgi:glutathione S-transferase
MVMSKYVLYGGKFTRALITEMVLLEAGLDYELREIDIIGQQHLSGEYTNINPAALVPSLVTPSGEILYETPAINLYLAEHHAVEHLAPLVGDPDRGPFLSALFFITDELEPVFKRYFYPHRYVCREQDVQRMQADSLAWSMRLLGVINQRLEQRGPFCLGARFSLVDLTLAYWMGYLSRRYSMDDIPAVMEGYEKVLERKPIREKFNQLDAMRAEYEVMLTAGKGVK